MQDPPFLPVLRIRDPGWKKLGSGFGDKHLGSATLHSTLLEHFVIALSIIGAVADEHSGFFQALFF
jgi:hypothetical protein